MYFVKRPSKSFNVCRTTDFYENMRNTTTGQCTKIQQMKRFKMKEKKNYNRTIYALKMQQQLHKTRNDNTNVSEYVHNGIVFTKVTQLPIPMEIGKLPTNI